MQQYNTLAQQAGLDTPQGKQLRSQAQALAMSFQENQRRLLAQQAQAQAQGQGQPGAVQNTPQNRLVSIQKNFEAFRQRLAQVKAAQAQPGLSAAERERHQNDEKDIIQKYQLLQKYLQETLIAAGVPAQQANQIARAGGQSISAAVAAVNQANNNAGSAGSPPAAGSTAASPAAATLAAAQSPAKVASPMNKSVATPPAATATAAAPTRGPGASQTTASSMNSANSTPMQIDVKPVVAQQGPPARPTFSGGLAGQNPLTGTPGIQRAPNFDANATSAAGNPNALLSKKRIQELLSQIDPNERLEGEVEDILLEIADEFIESATSFACRLAKHRKSDKLEVKDLQLHLERNWNIRVPGYAEDEIRSVRKPHVPQSHQQKLQAVSNAKQAR